MEKYLSALRQSVFSSPLDARSLLLQPQPVRCPSVVVVVVVVVEESAKVSKENECLLSSSSFSSEEEEEEMRLGSYENCLLTRESFFF